MTETTTVFVCGGDMRPGSRDECPNAIHDWPLPSGYVDAFVSASRRLGNRWSQKRCPDCRRYGWLPGKLREGEDVQVSVGGSL